MKCAACGKEGKTSPDYWEKCVDCVKWVKKMLNKEDEDSGVLIIDGVTQSVKNQRRGHEKDLLQPMRKDGTINPAFVYVHGTHSIEKNMNIKRSAIMESIENYG